MAAGHPTRSYLHPICSHNSAHSEPIMISDVLAGELAYADSPACY